MIRLNTSYHYEIKNNLFRFDPGDYDRFDMTPEEVLEMCLGVYKTFLTPKFALRRIKYPFPRRYKLFTQGGLRLLLITCRILGRQEGGIFQLKRHLFL